MWFFSALGLGAIVAGGIFSAFSARHPTRFAMWLTAYLVLIVGLIQLGLIAGWQQLHLATSAIIIACFAFYNIGNAAVVIGRWLKGKRNEARFGVYIGSGLLIVSMLFLGGTALGAGMSWTLVWFLALIIVVIASAPIGVILSIRRRNDTDE